MALSVFQVIGVIFKHWGTLSRIVELGAPVLTEYRKVSEELNEHLNTVAVALGVARNASPEALSLDTKWIQGALNRAGYKIDIDGDYGVKTHEAVKQFQAKHGLTVDGWVGPETIAELLKV